MKNLLPLYYKMCLIDHDSLNSVFKRQPQQSLHRIVLCKYFSVSINEFNVIINCGNNALISLFKNFYTDSPRLQLFNLIRYYRM